KFVNKINPAETALIATRRVRRRGSEFRAAAETELLDAVVRLLRERECIVEPQRSERRFPNEADADRTTNMHRIVDCTRRRIRDARTEGRTEIPGDDLAGRREDRRAGIVPERAGISESGDLDARILGKEIKRRLQLETGAPVVRAAERISQNAGERKLRQVAWTNSGWRESTHQIGAHLEMIEHAQVATDTGDLAPLQMQQADNIGEHFAIVVEIGGSAEELHVAADAGEVLPELSQEARRRVP